LNTWTQNVGFPLVTVARQGNTNLIKFKQERFYISEEHEKEYGINTWWIPISYKLSNGTESLTEMDGQEFFLDVQRKDWDWLKVNIREQGMFRVNYDTNNWNYLITNFYSFSDLDKAGLINDALVLARSGRVNYSIAFSFVSLLRNDTSLVTWNAALFELRYIDIMMYDQMCHMNFRNFTEWLIDSAYNYVGWEEIYNESRIKTGLRGRILSLALQTGHASSIQYAKSLYVEQFELGNYTIPNDLLIPILRSVIREGGPLEFNTILYKYYNEHNSIEKKEIFDVIRSF